MLRARDNKHTSHHQHHDNLATNHRTGHNDSPFHHRTVSVADDRGGGQASIRRDA